MVRLWGLFETNVENLATDQKYREIVDRILAGNEVLEVDATRSQLYAAGVFHWKILVFSSEVNEGVRAIRGEVIPFGGKDAKKKACKVLYEALPVRTLSSSMVPF